MMFRIVLQRDILLIVRSQAACIQPLLFFIVVVSLFPLAIGAEPAVLRNIGPGVIWVASLLAVILSLDKLYQNDFEDGTLEQLLLSPQSDLTWIGAKILAHWLVTGLPLLILSPLVGLFFHLNINMILALLVSLLLGTPTLSLLGAIGSSLTVGLRSSGILLAMLVLPLYIPILIFGTSAVVTAGQGLPVLGHMAFLGACLLLALIISLLVSSYALRIVVD